jgi:hypothetical protein
MTHEATQRMLAALITETIAVGLSIIVAKTKLVVRGNFAGILAAC